MLLLLKSDTSLADTWLFRKGLKNAVFLSTETCGFGQIKAINLYSLRLFVLFTTE